jgi:ABC-2 type transport system permease protein
MLRASWAKALEYRAQVVLWVISGIFPLVMMAVWLAVVNEAGPISGWGRVDFISYYVGAAVVHQFTGSWVLWDWDDDIRLGSLSFKLLKPLDPVHHFLTDMLGFKLFVLAVLVPLAGIIAWLSPDITYAITPARALLAALACLSGLAVATLMATAFAMISFWSTQSSNVFSLVYGVGQFMSGWIVPLALFPPGLRQIAYWLPYRSTLSFPLEILLGRATPPEIAFGFAVTALWITIFLVIYRLLWRLGLRRYEAVGA